MKTAKLQIYYAKSILTSTVFLTNLGFLILQLSEMKEFTDLIPPGWSGAFGAFVAAVNIALRPKTVRPVAFVRPGRTKRVAVPSLPTPESSRDPSRQPPAA
jgi:hypothetical protein